MERHFLLFKDQLAESGRQKTKENIIPRGKFRQVENDPKAAVKWTIPPKEAASLLWPIFMVCALKSRFS